MGGNNNKATGHDYYEGGLGISKQTSQPERRSPPVNYENKCNIIFEGHNRLNMM